MSGTPPRRHHLKWNGAEWIDERCGCRYHPDDDNGTHGGAPHVHLCKKHRAAFTDPGNNPFERFPRIGRLFRDIVVTEKIDGTNVQVIVSTDGEQAIAGSRNRLISVQDDHFGFARFVEENTPELLELGPGRHFGEWWGDRIGRGYDLPAGERRFSLFNTERWGNDAVRPPCCHVVPVLYAGPFSEQAIRDASSALALAGSAAAPGFMSPEGVVIYHAGSDSMFKYTLHGDGHKSRDREGT